MVLVYTFGVSLIGSQIYSMAYRVTAVLANPSVKRRFLSWPVVVGSQLTVLAATAGLSYAIHVATVRDTDELYDGRDLALERTLNAAGEWVWIHRDLWRALLRKMKEMEHITDEDTSIMCFNTLDWSSHYLHAGILVLFVLTEILSSSAAFWIIRRVGRLSSQSQAARRMHVQLTRLLLLQMMCPLICMVGPVLYFVICIVGRFTPPLVGFYMGLVIIGVFPMFNAVLTITFVGPYRQFTVGWMRAAVKGDMRAINGEQASAVASLSPSEEAVVRVENSLVRIQGNVRVSDERRNTVFSIRSNQVYPDYCLNSEVKH